MTQEASTAQVAAEVERFLLAGKHLSPRELAAESGLSATQVARLMQRTYGKLTAATRRKMAQFVARHRAPPPVTGDRTPRDIIGEIRVRLDQLEELTGEWKRLR